ncbi:hypothetical protein KQH62_05340 [bacterium]|nr:hypothetical protein [bacterium]
MSIIPGVSVYLDLPAQNQPVGHVPRSARDTLPLTTLNPESYINSDQSNPFLIPKTNTCCRGRPSIEARMGARGGPGFEIPFVGHVPRSARDTLSPTTLNPEILYQLGFIQPFPHPKNQYLLQGSPFHRRPDGCLWRLRFRNPFRRSRAAQRT